MANALKPIYQAPTTQVAEVALDEFEAGELGNKNLGVVRIWRNVWDRVIPFFAFSPAIRKLLYTTNATENLSRAFEELLKLKKDSAILTEQNSSSGYTMKCIAKKWKHLSPVLATAIKEMVVMYGVNLTKNLNYLNWREINRKAHLHSSITFHPYIDTFLQLPRND